MQGLDNTIMATFFDLYENGMVDVILVHKDGQGKYRIGAFTNITQDSDAYFVKVIVLSGKPMYFLFVLCIVVDNRDQSRPFIFCSDLQETKISKDERI